MSTAKNLSKTYYTFQRGFFFPLISRACRNPEQALPIFNTNQISRYDVNNHSIFRCFKTVHHNEYLLTKQIVENQALIIDYFKR